MPAFLLLAQSGADVLPLSERLWLFAGKLHPMLVHFPIALLIVAAMLEMLRIRRGEGTYRPSPAAMTCLLIGAISAIAAAVAGWSDAVTSGHGADAVLTHRWLGVLAAIVAALAACAAIVVRVRPVRRAFAAYRAITLLAALCVGAAGHFGAALVHGESYIADALVLLRAQPRESNATVEMARASPQAAARETVDFTRDIRPIFARRCFACHSGAEPAGGLNLDDRANLIAGGASGRAAIAPGEANNSRLIALITHGEGDLVMPPKGARLGGEQVGLITRWIDQGAKWTSDAAAENNEHWHWAYRSPQRPNPPSVKDTRWPRNPIDHFILARLEAEGLKPSPPADRSALIRRVSLDLTGLPPTPDEVHGFLDDHSAQAYERIVDRLLASPHFGERWARLWLDLARYADTHGYEKDDRRVMWPWRDWVINAFNDDMPFDQFTIEQLAGDLLPTAGGPTLDQRIATGFNRNSMINEEGGVDAEEFRVEAVIDRVNTFSSVWLGSTVGCAQCHDHKYDPFPQRDYYRLYAFFNQDQADARLHATGAFAGGPMVDVPAMEHRAEYARVRNEIAATESQLEAARGSASRETEIAAWERDSSQREPAWTTLQPVKVTASNGTTFVTDADGAILAGGASPDKEKYVVEALCDLDSIAALRLEVMPDDATPAKAVGRSAHGNIVLSDVRIEIIHAGEPDRVDPASIVAIAAAGADFEQPRTFGGGGFWPIADAIDADDQTGGWALGPQLQQSHVAVLQLAEPIKRDAANPIRLRISLVQHYGGQHTLARFRLSATSEPDALALKPLAPEVLAILSTSADQRSEEQRNQLAAHFDSIAPDLAPWRALLAALKRRLRELTAARAMVMASADQPRDTFIHVRGNFLDPGEPVAPDVPAIFPLLPPESASAGGPRDRLALARWTVDPKNPLTARVAVNRFWEQFFGRGIVFTSDDFGTQGEEPSHPELLDWLASEFVRDGWSVKRLLKSIVMSETYQQSSRMTVESRERDPHNILLARGPRFRVEAETVRDIALRASGLLHEKVGGPSVFPPQPDGIWTMIYSSDKWMNSTGDDAHRRGLYTFWRRTAPYPTFVSFDAPSRELSCTRRPRTNTPLQALTTLNDPAFVEAANALAQRMIESGESDRQRIEHGFLRCVSRVPTEQEVATVSQLLADQRAAFAADVEAAMKLAGATIARENAGEVAAWQVVANVLLNLDETVTKE